MMQFPILSLLIWLPVIGAFLALCAGEQKQASLAKIIAVVVTLINLLLSIVLYLYFDPSRYDMQFVENHLWVRAYQTYYALGIDGISLVMMPTAFLAKARLLSTRILPTSIAKRG